MQFISKDFLVITLLKKTHNYGELRKAAFSTDSVIQAN